MTCIRIGVATTRAACDPDPDQEVLLDAMSGAGCEPILFPWEDPVPPCDGVLIKSTWNYVAHHDTFLNWADALGEACRNRPAVVRWNTDKRYLRELQEASLPIVPTLWISDFELGAFAAQVASLGPIVVKPVVSAGSFGTRRFDRPSEALLHASRIGAERRIVMVQPYLPTIETHGERSLVWIDGHLTHAVRKSPRFEGDPMGHGPTVSIAPDERELAERVMAYVRARFGEVLYARIDQIRTDDGVTRLMELELTEPCLMLDRSADAATALARGLRRSFEKV